MEEKTLQESKECLCIPFRLVEDKAKLKDELENLNNICNEYFKENEKTPEIITTKLVYILNIPVTNIVFEDEDLHYFAKYLRDLADELEEIGYMGTRKDEENID